MEPMQNPETRDDREGPYDTFGTCAGAQSLNWAGRCQPFNEGTCPGTSDGCTNLP